jgi:hypothetical protein
MVGAGGVDGRIAVGAYHDLEADVNWRPADLKTILWACSEV